MTREEASIIIGNIPIVPDECYTVTEYQEAKGMAIEALKEPKKVVNCNDCFWNSDSCKPKKGEWIIDDIDFSERAGYELDCHCSKCKHEEIFYDSKSTTEPCLKNCRGLYNFCPHCGADMRGGKHD